MGLLRFIACILLLIFVAPLLANGVYMPEQAVPVMPAIPLQRALITYRDGTETLVLESAFKTESARVGWIVPLPHEPSKVDVGDPDMLRVLEMNQQPQVLHDLHEVLGDAWLWLIAVAPLPLTILVIRRYRTGWSVMLMPLLWLICLAFALPQFANAGMDISMPGISVSSTHRVGEYQTTVLRAKDAGALSGWLTAQSLRALDNDAVSVVDAYAREGWCFVVSTLRADAAQTATPRPLMLSFPAKQCVFPMRLTRIANTNTRVELYVAAEQQAKASLFHCAAADRYTKTVADNHQGAFLAAASTGVSINNPDASNLLWDGSIVTKLTADLSASQMIEDVALSFTPLAPHRDHFVSKTARIHIVRVILIYGLLAWLFLLPVVYWRSRQPGRLGNVVLLAGALLVMLGALGAQVLVPAIEVESLRRIHPYEYRSSVQSVDSVIAALNTQGELRPNMTAMEMIELAVANGKLRPVGNFLENDKPLTEARTPGNVSLRREGDKIWFCIYDPAGKESRLLLTFGRPE